MIRKPRVLVTAELVKNRLDELAADFEFEYAGYAIDRTVMPRDELKRRIVDADVLICEYDTVDAEILRAADRLKLIVCCRGGVKSVVDIEAARKAGVVVCNTAGRNASAVADLILGYVLDLTRNISRTSKLIHAKVLAGYETTKPDEYKDVVWGLGNDSPFVRFRGRSLCHMKIGIVGFGHAGRELARKMSFMGMDVCAFSPHIGLENLPTYVSAAGLDELISTSDVVSVNCALNDQTRDLFDAARFAQMKPGAYFINTSRGEIVVEQALADALKSGHLSGAALDVTRKEPIPADSPLIGIENLILTPHIGGSADDVQKQGTELAIKSLLGWYAGEQPINCVLGRGVSNA